MNKSYQALETKRLLIAGKIVVGIDLGKRSRQVALRTLAFKWIRILFRCWKNRTPYDQAKYLMALQQKGSHLLKTIANA